MPAPSYVTSDNYPYAGLYIRERNPPATVQGVINNTVGIAGQCVKGPVGVAVQIDSEQRFYEVFGARDYGAGGTLIGHVWRALLNKPFGLLVVARAAAAAAATAEKDFVQTATPIVNITATSPGAWGNDVQVTIQDATDGDANHWDLVVTWNDRRQHFKNLDTTAGNNNLLATLTDDYGNLVSVTKLADGRPDNAAAGGLTDTTGTDGSIADSDYTATNGPIEKLSAAADVGVIFVAGRSNTAIKAKLNTEAAAANDRVYLFGPDSSSVSYSTFITEVAGLTRDDRFWPTFNHPNTLDVETSTTVETEPMEWMASILSQTDPDVHPGDPDNRAFLAGITSLTWSLTATAYGLLRAAGISALEQDGGYLFVDAVTSDLTPGNEEAAVRRMKDFLIQSFAEFLKGSVKKPNTKSRRYANKAAIEGFLLGLWRQERYVDFAEDGSTPGFVVDVEKLNTVAQRAAGIEKILVRVKLLGFMIFLVLEAEIGTAVKITELQAA